MKLKLLTSSFVSVAVSLTAFSAIITPASANESSTVSVDSWNEVTNSVADSLSAIIQDLKDSYNPEPSPEEIQQLDDSVTAVFTTNGFPSTPASYDSSVLTPGAFWGYKGDALFLSYSTTDVSCVSTFAINDYAVLVPAVTVVSSACVPRVDRANSIALLNFDSSVKDIMRTAELMGSSAGTYEVSPRMLAKSFNQFMGTSVKPSKKFLKGKGVFSAGDLTAKVSGKTYNVSFNQAVNSEFSFKCTATINSASLKINAASCA